MGYELQQNQSTYHLFFLMVDSADHITGKTGLTPTVTLSKNGAAFASPAGAITEIGNGQYKLAGNATDENTLGPLMLHASSAGADPKDDTFLIVAYNPFDAVRLGLTALPNAAAEAAGGLYTRGSGAGQINQPNNGEIDANAKRLGGTTQTGLDLGSTSGVYVQNGTTTGKLDFTGGVVKANLAQILGTAITETSGQIAAAFKKFFDIATPAATMDHGILVDTITTYTGNTKQTGDNYPRLGAPAGASMSADIAAINAKTTNLPGSPAAVGSAMTLTSGERDSVAAALLDLADAIETGLTVRKALRAVAAGDAGETSGGGTGTFTIKGAGVATNRIQGSYDANGNRSGVTLNL